MTTTIHARGFELTDGIHDHVQRRVRTAVGRFGDKLTRVVVRLTDVNGPRGGVDKRCLVTVTVPGQSDLVVKALKTDLYAAVDCATGSVARTLARRLKRLRGRR